MHERSPLSAPKMLMATVSRHIRVGHRFARKNRINHWFIGNSGERGGLGKCEEVRCWLPPRDSNPDMLLQRQLSYLPPAFQRHPRLSFVVLSFQYVKQEHTLSSTRVASPENTGKPGIKVQNVTPKVIPLVGPLPIEHATVLLLSVQ
jgi:hypothetical protein